MNEVLKVVIPMAGFGARLRPLTWSRPKPLIPLAGKTILDYLLLSFKSLPANQPVEYVFILGNMGEQIKDHLKIHYPEIKAHFVVQSEMKGQSDALWLAREYLHGPILVAYTDTLVEADFSAILHDPADAIVWVKAVEDPRRFGVAEINPEGMVNRLIEKPKTTENNLVMVGVYHFKDGEKLIQAIEEQVKRKVALHGEYYLTDAVNILLEQPYQLRAQSIETWLDAGTPETVLSTNRYYLEHGADNTLSSKIPEGSALIPPVFVHPSAEISSSVIGPNVSIGANCRIESCILKDVIIDSDTHLTNAILENSILGHHVQISGKAANVILGDQTRMDI